MGKFHILLQNWLITAGDSITAGNERASQPASRRRTHCKSCCSHQNWNHSSSGSTERTACATSSAWRGKLCDECHRVVARCAMINTIVWAKAHTLYIYTYGCLFPFGTSPRQLSSRWLPARRRPQRLGTGQRKRLHATQSTTTLTK